MINFKKLVGEKIRAKRIARGFKTQDEFAKAISDELDQARVSDWERGVHLPGEYKDKLLKVLNSDESLLDIVESVPKYDLSVAADLLTAFVGSNADQKKLVLAILYPKQALVHLREVSEDGFDRLLAILSSAKRSK